MKIRAFRKSIMKKNHGTRSLGNGHHGHNDTIAEKEKIWPSGLMVLATMFQLTRFMLMQENKLKLDARRGRTGQSMKKRMCNFSRFWNKESDPPLPESDQVADGAHARRRIEGRHEKTLVEPAREVDFHQQEKKGELPCLPTEFPQHWNGITGEQCVVSSGACQLRYHRRELIFHSRRAFASECEGGEE